MYEFFQFMIQIMENLMLLMDTYSFPVPTPLGNITISYLQLIFGFIVLGFVIYAFWKGAKA